MEWLARPMVADGLVVAGPLDPSRLSDADLLSICLRMHAILDSVEMPRCEGRLIPTALFDAIDTLASQLRHPGPSPPLLSEWAAVIREFGAHYGLSGTGPIAVEPSYWSAAVSRVVAGRDAEPGATADGGRV